MYSWTFIKCRVNNKINQYISTYTMYMNTNLYENKSGDNEHMYFIIKLYENKPDIINTYILISNFMKINQDIIVT